MIGISVDNGTCYSANNSSPCDADEGYWANCVAGTLKEKELIGIMQEAGFKDVECGASFLVDNLLEEGYKNITYICNDILNFIPTQKFDIFCLQ